MSTKDWIESWHKYEIHPSKSIMVDMIGEGLGTSVSGLYKCDNVTIAKLWIALINKKVIK